jgi:acyl-CoA thioesterase YciA
MNKIEFKEPVLVGDVVSFWTRPVRVGRTSITIHVAVQAERDGRVIDVTAAEVVYVAVEKQADGKFRPVPIKPE